MVEVKTGLACEGNTHGDPVSAIFVPVGILIPICHEQQALYDNEIVVLDIKVIKCLLLLVFHSLVYNLVSRTFTHPYTLKERL